MSLENLVFLALQGLIGIALWMLKTMYSDLKLRIKEQEILIKAQQIALHDVRETYFKKEDWKDFRDELWNRLDKMEHVFEQKIKEIKSDSR